MNKESFKEWRRKAIERHEKRPIIAMFKELDAKKKSK
jgi:hypothetical protein